MSRLNSCPRSRLCHDAFKELSTGTQLHHQVKAFGILQNDKVNFSFHSSKATGGKLRLFAPWFLEEEYVAMDHKRSSKLQMHPFLDTWGFPARYFSLPKGICFWFMWLYTIGLINWHHYHSPKFRWILRVPLFEISQPSARPGDLLRWVIDIN